MVPSRNCSEGNHVCRYEGVVSTIHSWTACGVQSHSRARRSTAPRRATYYRRVNRDVVGFWDDRCVLESCFRKVYGCARCVKCPIVCYQTILRQRVSSRCVHHVGSMPCSIVSLRLALFNRRVYLAHAGMMLRLKVETSDCDEPGRDEFSDVSLFCLRK